MTDDERQLWQRFCRTGAVRDKVLRARDGLLQELGREPTVEEIRQKAKVNTSPEQIADMFIARRELVLRYYSSMKVWVRRLSKSKPGVSWKDLEQAGALGLIEAVDHFEPTLGYEFSTYARYHIRNRLLNSPDVTNDVSRNQAEMNRKVLRTHDTLLQLLGRKPTREEIAHRLARDTLKKGLRKQGVDREPSAEEINKRVGSTLQQIEDSLLAIAIGFPEFLPEIADPRRDERNLADTLDVQKALMGLTERERFILCLFYYEDCEDDEIARRVQLKPNHIKQLRFRAMQQLREWFDVKPKKNLAWLCSCPSCLQIETEEERSQNLGVESTLTPMPERKQAVMPLALLE